MLEKLLKSRTQVLVLGALLSGESIHLRGIAKLQKISPSQAKRELDKLESIGVVKVERQGNQAIYAINPRCPFITELKSLYLKTEGALGKIGETLEKLEGIKYAFVYGSIAKGTARKESDVDLLVIGSAPDEITSEKLFKLQNELGVAVNFILWTPRDFERKLSEKSAFIKSVLRNQKEWLVGDEHEFGRIAEKALGGKGRS